MGRMLLPNTLWNNDATKTIAKAEQIQDDKVDWNDNTKAYNGTYPNPDYDPSKPESPTNPKTVPVVPADYKNKKDSDNLNISKFQSSLNEFFLNHWASYQQFLHSKLEEGVIDSWKDIEDFLKGISDDEATKLVNIITYIQTKGGCLNVRMCENVPGRLEAVTTNDQIDQAASRIDETGAILISFDYPDLSDEYVNPNNTPAIEPAPSTDNPDDTVTEDDYEGNSGETGNQEG